MSVLRNFLQPDPRCRLGARGDALSILKHPFFKTVNWEAVLQKLVTPPLKPQTLEFLNVDPAAPADADDIAIKSSIENREHEAILETPINQQDPLVPEDQLVLEDPHVP